MSIDRWMGKGVCSLQPQGGGQRRLHSPTSVSLVTGLFRFYVSSWVCLGRLLQGIWAWPFFRTPDRAFYWMVLSLDAWLDAFFMGPSSLLWCVVCRETVFGIHSLSFCLSENVANSLPFLKASLSRSTNFDAQLKAALCPLTWAGCSEWASIFHCCGELPGSQRLKASQLRISWCLSLEFRSG